MRRDVVRAPVARVLPAARVLGWAVAGLVAALLLVLLSPLAVGGRAAVVVSGSMEPALLTGDVVLVVPAAPTDVRLGEVVVRGAADPAGMPVSHRLVDRSRDGDQVTMTTRGDANPTSETWTLPADGTVGRVVLRVPWLGRAVAAVSGALPGLPLVLLPAVVLLVLELRDVWWPRAGHASEDDAQEDDAQRDSAQNDSAQRDGARRDQSLEPVP